MIEITITPQAALAALEDLERRISDPWQRMQSLGEYMVNSTKERIKSGGPAPDGTPYAPKSPVTMANYMRKREGVNATPLNHLGDLFRQIHHDAASDSVEISANTIYAAVQQFGARQGAFCRTKRNGPIPWGNIPARPFIGLSTEDEANIEDEVTEYLGSSFLRHAD